jgi:hypothetical protein
LRHPTQKKHYHCIQCKKAMPSFAISKLHAEITGHDIRTNFY